MERNLTKTEQRKGVARSFTKKKYKEKERELVNKKSRMKNK